MIQKPEIQYVGQFYIYGSEARQLEPKKKRPKTRLPLQRLEKIEKIYVDPVAIAGIFVAIVMLVAMLVGAMQIRSDWKEYERMSSYVQNLDQKTVQLTRNYRNSYDLNEIRAKAVGLGLVPVDQVESVSVRVTVPEPEPVLSWQEKLAAFWNGLWE